MSWLSNEMRDEKGFTLLELMVVVLIIAILLAIAIPTFLGTRRRAQDRRAQSNLRNALTVERAYYTQNARFSANSSELETWEPSLDWSQSNAWMDGVLPSAPGEVIDPGIDLDGNGSHSCSVSSSNGVTTVTGDCYLDASMVCLVSLSASGTKFVMVSVASGPNAGTYFNEDVDCPSDQSALAGWSQHGW
jgi:type IV pilus assembly protein PilA